MKGKVKWFNIKKRYGFITDESGVDHFVHASDITGGRTFTGFDDEDEVEFEIGEGNKGPQAINVKLIKNKENK